MQEGFSITPNQANALIDKLYEIWGRKFGVEITLIRKGEKNEKEKKGLHGNRTRDLSHPKRESYH